MALTRITKGVIKPNENYDTHNINSTGIVTAVGGNFTGDLTVGGVLTYEDVTSIDSVGIITAQKGIHVGAGISVVGVSTFNSKIVTSDEIDIGSNGNPGRIRLHNGSGGYVFQVASIGGNLTLRSSNGGVRADDNIGRPLFFGSPGGAFNIYHSGNKKLETLSKGIKVGSGVTIETNGQATFAGLSTHSEGIFVPDDKSIRVGGTFDNPDFKIHSSSTYQQAVVDYNRSGTGRALRIRATNLQIENWNGLTPTVKVIGGTGAGHVELNYAGNKKFETTAQGIEVTGHSELDNVNIAGVTTVASDTSFIIGTNATSKYNIDFKQNSSNNRNSIDSFYMDFSIHDLQIRDESNNSLRAYFWPAEVALYSAGGKKFSTIGSGIKVHTVGDGHGIILDNTTYRNNITAESNRPGANNSILELDGKWNNTQVAFMTLSTGDDTTNKDDGRIRFFTKPSGGSITERARIETDGRLNVGNTDLNQNVDQFSVTVSAQNAVDNVARFQSSAAASGTSESLVKVYKGAGYGGVISGYITQGSDHGMKLYTANNGSLTERLRINSTGYVTKPFQPAFHARPPAAYSTPNNTDTIIGGTWSTSDSESFVRGTLTNGTSIWDNGTGIFTVPVTGVYYFHLTLFLRDNTTRRDALIYRNGTSTSNIIARTEVMGQQGSGNRNVSVSTVVFLSANDTIRFGARNTGNTATLYTTSKPWSYACGYLVS